jgi:hypothetical protein
VPIGRNHSEGLRTTSTSKLNDLTDEQNRDLNKFDRQRQVSLPPKFRKTLGWKYRELRKRERLLVRNQDYVTADTVKQRADVLEEEENTQSAYGTSGRVAAREKIQS